MNWKLLLLFEHIIIYWVYSGFILYNNKILVDINKLNKYVIMNVISNQIIGSSIFYYFNFDTIESDLLELVPLFWDLLILSFIHSIYFYVLHWLFHIKILYDNIHCTHHTNYITLPHTAIHCHIVEHVFVNIMSVLIGAKIHTCHRNSIILWVWIATISSINTHSGFLRKKNPAKHDYHHLLKNVNYGSGYTFMDKLFGTCKN
jgi:sterol desaturase/sphingolipid hydroxylase (fatty acid hydroxylase superfamily)